MFLWGCCFGFLLTGARGVNFLLFALPLMGSFFIGCMPSGINFLHRTQKADFKGNGRQGIFGILTFPSAVDFQFIWNTQFSTENCGRLPVEYPRNRLTEDAGTWRISRPPYLRDGKCWPYTKGRKPMEMLTVRILAEKQAKPCHFVKRKMTSCHFKANGTLVATIRVRAKELSKVISNNIV